MNTAASADLRLPGVAIRRQSAKTTLAACGASVQSRQMRRARGRLARQLAAVDTAGVRNAAG
ncbi:hypothetical protein [Burkholderia sp. TSV86]|uniref:hypothetical protein n=1 Tax=Burkholderia sp. TSV86 TaxID=1385594 RepID=UPI0012E397B9|nr:hypothetical protein [Burkholderia sp. TSV86]